MDKEWTANWTVITLVGIGIVAVAIVDYLMGPEFRAFPLYFLPLLLAARYLPHVMALATALVVTIVWAIVQYLGGHSYSEPYLWAVNIGMQGVAFLVVAWLFTRVRGNLQREREISRTDPLTGLPNSRSFFERAGSVLAMCHRDNQPATLAYIDLDNFKNANDTLGHMKGDALLRRVGDVLNEQLRTSDIAARLGGDEFAVLLPETDEASAMIALEKVRNRIARAEDFLSSDVTASIGAVTSTPAPIDITGMIKAADKLMYRVKAGDKNRVLVQGLNRT